MFRWIGVAVVIMGSSGFAFSIVRERKVYLERCRAWRELFALIENEIAFQKSSLPEICSRAGLHLSGNGKIFLEQIGGKLGCGGGATLGEIWRQEAKCIFEAEPLKKETESRIEALGEKLCFEDSDMQKNILRDMEQYLLKHEKEQENLDRERNKLTLCAGVMGGLLLTILLL